MSLGSHPQNQMEFASSWRASTVQVEAARLLWFNVVPSAPGDQSVTDIQCTTKPLNLLFNEVFIAVE